MRISRVLIAAACFTGCAPPDVVFETHEVTAAMMQEATRGAPAYTTARIHQMLSEGRRNEVLHKMHLGLHAFEKGDDGFAQDQFDYAIESIRAIHTDPDLMQAVEQGRITEIAKQFRGEPYERAMLYWYRGIMELVAGNAEQARPYFVSGLFEDAFAENQEARSDFAVLLYLQAWASRIAGDDIRAVEGFSAAQKIRPHLTPPPLDHNVLIVAELGKSPRKVRDGLGQYQLKFRRGRGFTDDSAQAVLPNEAKAMLIASDIYHQASTRGKREIDYILTGQGIEFRRASDFATTSTEIAESVSLYGNLGDPSGLASGIAGGFALAGILSTTSQMNNLPLADNRFWDNLPDRIFLLTAKLSKKDPITVRVIDGTGQLVGRERHPIRSSWNGGYGFYWFKSHITTSTQYDTH